MKLFLEKRESCVCRNAFHHQVRKQRVLNEKVDLVSRNAQRAHYQIGVRSQRDHTFQNRAGKEGERGILSNARNNKRQTPHHELFIVRLFGECSLNPRQTLASNPQIPIPQERREIRASFLNSIVAKVEFVDYDGDKLRIVGVVVDIRDKGFEEEEQVCYIHQRASTL